MIFSRWVFLLAGVHASLMIRPFFKRLAKMENFDTMLEGTKYSYKDLLVLDVQEFLPRSLPERPSKFLLASLLDALNKNFYAFDLIMYSSTALSNPSNICPLLTQVKVIKT